MGADVPGAGAPSRAGRLTCARQSVVDRAASGEGRAGCGAGRRGPVLVRVGQGSLKGGPAARGRPTCTVSNPLGGPAAYPDSALSGRQSGADPPREADIGVRRPLDVALDALHVAGSADWRGAPPSAAIGPASARDLPLVTRLQGGSQPQQRCRQPDSAAGSAPLSAQGRLSHGPTRPHGPLSAHRAADHGLRHAISAPRAQRRRPLAWCERRVWKANAMRPGTPGPPPGPPCQFPARRRRGVEPLPPPCRSHFQIRGVQGQKKSGKWKSWGEVPMVGPRGPSPQSSCRAHGR